jgi:hypothetical protein
MLSNNNADFLSYTYSDRAMEELAESISPMFSFKEAHQGAVADDYLEEKNARYLKHSDLLSGSALSLTEEYLDGLANNWTETDGDQVKHYSFSGDDLLHYFHHLDYDGDILKDLPFGLQKKIFEDAKAGVSGAIYYIFWRMYIIISNRLYKFLGGNSVYRSRGLAGLRDGKKDFISIAYITLTKTYKQGGDVDSEKDLSALKYFDVNNASLAKSTYPSKYFSMFATLYDGLLNNSNMIHAKSDNGGLSHYTKSAEKSTNSHGTGADGKVVVDGKSSNGPMVDTDLETLGKITSDGGYNNKIDMSLSVSDDSIYSAVDDVDTFNSWKEMCEDERLYDAKYPTPADIIRYVVKYFFYDKRVFSSEDKKIIVENFNKEWDAKKEDLYAVVESKLINIHRDELKNKTMRPADIFRLAKEELQKQHDDELNSLITKAKKEADERSSTKNPTKTQSDLMHDLGKDGSVIGLAVLKTRFNAIDELFDDYDIKVSELKSYIGRHGNKELLKYIKNE